MIPGPRSGGPARGLLGQPIPDRPPTSTDPEPTDLATMSNTTTTTLPLCPGILIEGTLRPQDLIPAFLDTLHQAAPASYDQVMFGDGHTAVPSYALEDEGADWWHSEEASWVLDDLAGALDQRAQEDGMYFGPLETDPACWGFWMILDEDE